MPSRILRDGILTSERVNSLSTEAELFYRRLMSVVDDYGRYQGHPAILRAHCYPLHIDKVTDKQVKKWLDECEQAGLILAYIVSGKAYIEVADFRQRTRSQSRYPCPPNSSANTDIVPDLPLPKRRHDDRHSDGHDDGQVLSVLTNDGHRADNCPPYSVVAMRYSESVVGVGDGVGDVARAPSARKAQPSPLPDAETAFERCYALSLNKRDRVPAQRVFVDALSHGAEPDMIERCWKSWNSCELWTWKGGAKAQTFAQWLSDGNYRYDPPKSTSQVDESDPIGMILRGAK